MAEKPDWYAAERTLWEAALQADASGDPALVSLQEEAAQALAAFDVRRRVRPRPPPPWLKLYNEHPFRTPEGRNEACQPFRSASDRIAEYVR